MKILISWYAYNHDFEWNGTGRERKKMSKISAESPTHLVHKHFWADYDKHILLYRDQEEKDIRYYDYLYSEITKEFRNHPIEKMHLTVEDVIDVNEITQKITKLLSKYTKDTVDVYISPGTPSMQVAWFLASANFPKNVNLFQTRPAKFSKDPEKPEKVNILLDHSAWPTNLNIAESGLEPDISDTGLFITKSIRHIYKRAEAVAQTYDVTCLILGENGTGKENVASFIHKKSSRKNGPFKAINCAAYSDELLASELFGYVKGAFTGANSNKTGLFAEANGGTVFLDEIGDISPKMQVSLLRVLQEKEFNPVGSHKSHKTDIRIIAATNKNLYELSKSENFRWDLYYRLSVAEITLPSLRERGKDELKELLHHFITEQHKRFSNRKTKLTLSKDAERKILAYDFPGNARELQNLVIGLYTFSKGPVEVHDLPERIQYDQSPKDLSLEAAEKKHIEKIYLLRGKNKMQTAETLGIMRNTLDAKLKKLGIEED